MSIGLVASIHSPSEKGYSRKPPRTNVATRGLMEQLLVSIIAGLPTQWASAPPIRNVQGVNDMGMLRFDHVGVVVDDLDAATAFFVGLGFEREGGTTVEGEAVDKINGLAGVRAELMMVRTPDGTGSKRPPVSLEPTSALGYYCATLPARSLTPGRSSPTYHARLPQELLEILIKKALRRVEAFSISLEHTEAISKGLLDLPSCERVDLIEQRRASMLATKLLYATRNCSQPASPVETGSNVMTFPSNE